MDYVFWAPWAAGAFVFVLCVMEPIREFTQIWKQHHRDEQVRSDREAL